MSPQTARKQKIEQMFFTYIKGTAPKIYVRNEIIKVGHLCNKIDYSTTHLQVGRDVYCSNRVLKHIYDIRPQYCEGVFIKHAYSICSFPDYIYSNEGRGRGDIIFVKYINKELMCAVAQIYTKTQKNSYHIVTSFQTTKRYFKRKRILWKEGTANPLS